MTFFSSSLGVLEFLGWCVGLLGLLSTLLLLSLTPSKCLDLDLLLLSLSIEVLLDLRSLLSLLSRAAAPSVEISSMDLSSSMGSWESEVLLLDSESLLELSLSVSFVC